MAPQKKQNGSRMPLNQANQINQARQTNQANQKNQSNQSRAARRKNNGNNFDGVFKNRGNYTSYSVKNSGNMSNAGVIDVQGRARDIGQYKDRLGDNTKSYPNTNKKRENGHDLTTPLKDKLVVDVPKRAHRKLERENIKWRTRTVVGGNQNFPVSGLAVIVMIAFALMALIYSYSVLNEKSVAINKLRDEISFEAKREKILDRRLEIKNDLSFILNYAVDDLDMIKEDLLMKHYISAKSYDKVEVIGEKGNSNIIADFPNIMSAIFKK